MNDGSSQEVPVVRNSCQCKRHNRCGFDSWVKKIPWGRKWQPILENGFSWAFLENPMDRGAWQATVHRVAKSWTRWRTEQANITDADSWKAYPHAKSTQMPCSLLILENTRVLLSVHCKLLSSQWGRDETSVRRPQLFSTTPRSV